MTSLDHEQILTHLDQEVAKLVETANLADTSAAVPSTPGWNVTELLSHVDWVYRYVIGNVRDGNATPPPTLSLWPDEVVSRVEETSRDLVEALTEAEPDRPAWSWTTDHTAAFWVRRMVHETAIHRVDLQLIDDAVDGIAPDLAADGVDELLSTYLEGRKIWQQLPKPSTTALEAADTGDAWLVTLTEAGLTIEREPQDAELSVSGPAFELELALWGRAEPSTLHVEGDKTLWEAWTGFDW